MKPVIRTSDDFVKDTIEKTAIVVAEQAAKKAAEEMNKKFEDLKKSKIDENIENTGSSKISQIIKNVQSTASQQSFNETEKLEKASKSMHEHDHDDMLCPTCMKHDHKLTKIGNNRAKCTGKSCGVEYELIPINADYKCTTCNLPHKKPVESNLDDKCPFCDNNEFIKHDWKKELERLNKNKKK